MSLVTVAVVKDAAQAVALRRKLEDEGIDVFFLDSPGHNSGEIQVQVEDDDAGDAIRVLGADAFHLPDAPSTAVQSRPVNPRGMPIDESDDPSIDDGEDEVEPPLTPRERSARDAYRCSIFGLVMPLLWPYGLWLLLKTWFGRGTMSPVYRRKAWLGTLIYLAPFLVIAACVAYKLSEDERDLDMAPLARPEILQGKWKSNHPGRSMTIDLKWNGQAQFQSANQPQIEFSGPWGFDQFSLMLRIRKIQKDRKAEEGKTLVLPLEKMEDGNESMILDVLGERILFHRERP